MSGQYAKYSANQLSWKNAVADAGSLPTTGNNPGDARIALATDTLYVWNGSSWIAIATPGASTAIDALTGDVSATGPGSVPATVNSVGGSSASNVHSAELSANAATDANTASTIIKRDGLGNAKVSDPVAASDIATKNYVDTHSTGANTALSNLASVAINTSLLPGTDNSIDIGSSSKTFRASFIGLLKASDGNAAIDANSRVLKDFSGGNDMLNWNGPSLVAGVNFTPVLNHTADIGDSTHQWLNIHQRNSLLYGVTSGVITLTTADTTTSYSVKWPSAQGGANTALKNDGSGNLSWTSVPTGTGSANGTNTGDITLSVVGSSPNANAASLSGQVLNLQPFDSTHPGVVPASGGGTTNFLRADGTFATPSGGSGVSTGSQVIDDGDTINSDKDIYFLSSTQTDPGVVDSATIQTVAGASVPASSYWQIESSDYGSNVGFGFYVWYKVDGTGTDPNPGQLDGAFPTIGDAVGIEVDILSTDSASQVATKTFNILNNVIYTPFFIVSGLSGDTFTNTAALAGGFFNEDSSGAPTGFIIVDAGSGVAPTYASVTTSTITAIQAGTTVGQQLKLINQSADNYSGSLQSTGNPFGQITIKGYTITTIFGEASVDRILKPLQTLTLTWTGRAWTLDSQNLS